MVSAQAPLRGDSRGDGPTAGDGESRAAPCAPLSREGVMDCYKNKSFEELRMEDYKALGITSETPDPRVQGTLASQG